jgi:16S rRNA U516 pseudouridylate synthase RsuA-like enzyme
MNNQEHDTKVLSDRGILSRRMVDEAFLAGRITGNGVPARLDKHIT